MATAPSGVRLHATGLVALMLLSLATPMIMPNAMAHEDAGGAVWPMNGSEDTGWVTLDAITPDGIQPASADWNLTFAPGATLDNVSFQLRVSGADGMIIDSPLMIAGGSVGSALLDLSNEGWMGQTLDLDGGDPFMGRTSTSGLSSSWTLPGGATVTDLVIQALAPADPTVSLKPLSFEPRASAVHPDDGRLWLAVDDDVLVIDAAMSPPTIDIVEIPDVVTIVDLEVDVNHGQVLVLGTDAMHALDLATGALVPLPLNESTVGNNAPIQRLATDAGGNVIAVGDACLHERSTDGTWSVLSGCTTNTFPMSASAEILAMEVFNGLIHVSLAGDGVIRYDPASSTSTIWTTANVLHSDVITRMVQMGGQILFASDDAGIGRYNPQLNLWQATWSSANWLADDQINGLEVVGNELWVLAGASIQRYDINSGVFTTHNGPADLSDAGLGGDVPVMMGWPAGGLRAPSNHTLLIGDGTGTFLRMAPGATPMVQNDLVLATSPPISEMTAVAAYGDEVHVGGDDLVAVYNSTQRRWTGSTEIVGVPTAMVATADALWVATEEHGLAQIDGATGSLQQYTRDPSWNAIVGLAVDDRDVVMTHEDGGVSVWNLTDLANGNAPWESGTTSDVPADATGEVAIYNRTAYLASEGGLLRLDLDGGPAWQTSWGSTGIDQSFYAPIAEFQGVLHYGLYGYGVVRIDLATGELLEPLLDGNGNGARGALPSDDIYSVSVTNVRGSAELAIGTQSGAILWDGSSAYAVPGGRNWDERPGQHLEFMDLGSYLYAATNLGVCRWQLDSGGGLDIDECLTVYDGMPNWATYSLGHNSTHLFGGTLSGVGVIAQSSFSVVDTWETLSADNAPVAVVGDVAYIGMDGIGVARWDMVNGAWLSLWKSSGVLDTNGITGLVGGTQANTLWVGGDDGFQLIDVINATELVDIEKSSGLYYDNGDPYDLIMVGDVLHYNQRTASDRIYRIDTSDFTSAVNYLDIGVHLNEGGLDVAGMGRMGDVIVASAVSGQWWNTQGSGGIVRWDATNNNWLPDILPDASIEVMEVLQASNGDTWIQYGDDGLEVLDANGTKVLEWDASVTPDLPNGQGGYPYGGGMVEWGGEILFASETGVGAYDPSAGTWSTYWSSTSTPEVYELWTDGTTLFIGATSGSGWNPDGVVIMEDVNGTRTTMLSSNNGDFSNAYPISIEACDGMVWTAFFQLSGGAQVIGVDPNGVAADVVIDGQDLGTNARPAALACSGTELHIGFWSVSTGIVVWDLASSQVIDQLTSADGLSESAVYYDAMSLVGPSSSPSIAVGHDTASGEGGYSVYSVASRAPVVRERGSLVTTVISDSSGAVVYGIPGQSSGFSQAGTWSPTSGASIIGSRIQLNSGAVSALAGSGTTLYAATYDPTAGFGTSSGGNALLIGTVASNGTLTWTEGHAIPSSARVSSLALSSQAVHAATAESGAGNGGSISGQGLLTLHLSNNTWSKAANGLTDDLDGLAWYGNDLVTGLVGGGGGVSGVQMYDPTTDAFFDGGVLGGLPSNTVLGLSRTSASDVVHIATDSGVGRFDRSLDGWDTPITTVSGLPSNNVEDVITWFDAAGNENVLLATDGGLALWNASSAQMTATWDEASGLLETSVWGLHRNSTDGTVLLAHDGLGTSRPGATVLGASSSAPGGFVIDDTLRFDQLPSNDVTAVASDWWGLHIATESGTMTHWNPLSEEFEEGLDRTPTNQRVERITSDGTTAVLMTANGIVLVEASAFTHAELASETVIGISDVALDASGAVWASTFDDGLAAWGAPPGYLPVPSAASLRATPLNLGVGTGFADVTEYLHPGTSIDLLDLVGVDALTLPAGTAGGLTPTALPLVFSSTSQGAAVWASTDLLLWNGTFEMADDAFVNRLQSAVDTGRMLNGNLTVQTQLFSPVNGSMEVRLIYDWSRTETPIELLDLSDRPDDGGGALRASWSLVHDDDFARYLVYVKQDGWATPPTAADLQTSNIEPDAAIALHSRLQADVLTAGGSPLVDGRAYEAVIVVEYADGRLGTPSMPLGPASPSDEVPRPPNSGEAMPSTLSNAAEGDLDVRWERCTALDHASTRLYASTVERTDVLGLSPVLDLPKTEGNETLLSLQPGRVYWIGLTCVDEAGQENLSDALILGPVVPTGGLDDGRAPPPLENVEAVDAPNDEGGRLLVTWTPSMAVDCAFYTVWLHELGDLQNIDQAGESDGAYATRVADAAAALRDGTLVFEEAEVVTDCAANGTVVDDIGGRALVDGRTYLAAVTAHDVWLNVDLSLGDSTIIDDAIPYKNVIDEGAPPSRLQNVQAFDHPGDDGTAVDVVFSPSAADDFDHYLVWTFTQEITNVSAWHQGGLLSDSSTALRIDTQQIDSDGSPFEITMNEALHQNEDGAWSMVPVEDGMTVHVAVTVHDLRGNVHLDDLATDDALAVDNLADKEAPDRIEELVATDRPDDDGSAVLLEFLPSTASDVDSYEVYALSAPFNRVSESAAPSLILGRAPVFPVVVDRYSDGSSLEPGALVHLAVVVRDTSGNAHLTDLVSVSAEPIDDGVEDPGVYLDPIAGVTVAWLDETDVLVAWDHTNDPSVRAYRVYFASESYADVEAATMAGEVLTSSSFKITADAFPQLVNSTGWYIAVTPVDDAFERKTVEPVFLAPLTESSDSEGAVDDGLDFSTYLTGPNAIIAGLVLITFLLVLLVLRRRGGGGSKTYTLQEATWGIQEDAFGPIPTGPAPAAPPAAPAPAAPSSALAAPEALSVDLYAAAQQLSPARMEAPVTRPPVQTNDIDGLLGDLGLDNQAPPKQGGLDTSFLDDLL